MRFDILYHDGVNRHDLSGEWDELPDVAVQFVWISDRRGRVHVSGYDSYAFDEATGLFSVFFDDPLFLDYKNLSTIGHVYLLRPGVLMEYLGPPSDYGPGEIPREAKNARIKSGLWLDDDKAEELGFRPKEWREANNVPSSP